MEKQWSENREAIMRRVYDLLLRLGAHAGNVAFFHTAYTVYLAMENPERLILVTKWLYPVTAKEYRTNWRAVERNIRSVIRMIWLNDPTALRGLAGNRLYSRPTPTKFIALLAGHLAAQEHRLLVLPPTFGEPPADPAPERPRGTPAQ